MTWLIGLIAIALVVCWIVAWKVLPKRIRRATIDLAQSIETLAVGEFVVRRAAAPDVVTILETTDQAFMEANGWNQDTADSSAEQLRTHAPDQLGYVSVCDRDGSMLGYGLIHGVTHSRSRCTLAFSLHPSRRSQGLGPGALAVVLAALHQAGVRTVLIGTRQSNAAMISCIEHAGGHRGESNSHTPARRQPPQIDLVQTPLPKVDRPLTPGASRFPIVAERHFEGHLREEPSFLPRG